MIPREDSRPQFISKLAQWNQLLFMVYILQEVR